MADASGQWNGRYDPERQELVVTFPNGRSYTFEGVPPEIAEGFEQAESKGTYYNTNLRGIY